MGENEKKPAKNVEDEHVTEDEKARILRQIEQEDSDEDESANEDDSDEQ